MKSVNSFKNARITNTYAIYEKDPKERILDLAAAYDVAHLSSYVDLDSEFTPEMKSMYEIGIAQPLLKEEKRWVRHFERRFEFNSGFDDDSKLNSLTSIM